MAKTDTGAPDPDATYICINAYSQDHELLPPMATFPFGCRLNGSHPAVRLRPECWIREDADDEEIARAQVAVGAPVRTVTHGARRYGLVIRSCLV
jgi:hypothetical protein